MVRLTPDVLVALLATRTR